MGKKRIKHHLFSGKVGKFLHEVVQAPPEPPKEAEEEISQEIEEEIQEVHTQEEKINDQNETEEIDEEQNKDDEKEQYKQRVREDILSSLNSATEEWKETGDVGLKLEPPVPMSQKFKAIIEKVERVGISVGSKVKEKISHKHHENENEETKLDTTNLLNEWKEVDSKKETEQSSDREEIEKMYEELSSTKNK